MKRQSQKLGVRLTGVLIASTPAALLARIDDVPARPVDLSSVYGNLINYAIVGFAVVVVFIVLILVMRKIQIGRRSDEIVGLSMTDLSSLQNRGLLTEEESRRVRQALTRQVTKQLSSSKPASGGLNSLLADPEVRRLEALAKTKSASSELDNVEEPAPEAAVTKPAPVEELCPEIALLNPTSNQEEEVELPPDVLTMVQLGLITEEELTRIKERARAKRSNLGL